MIRTLKPFLSLSFAALLAGCAATDQFGPAGSDVMGAPAAIAVSEALPDENVRFRGAATVWEGDVGLFDSVPRVLAVTDTELVQLAWDQNDEKYTVAHTTPLASITDIKEPAVRKPGDAGSGITNYAINVSTKEGEQFRFELPKRPGAPNPVRLADLLKAGPATTSAL